MLLAVSALDVALISAIAALIASTISPLTTWLVASATNRHERLMRIREDKKTAYESLLRDARRDIYVNEQAIAFLERARDGDLVGDELEAAVDELDLPEDTIDTFLEGSGSIRAYGSDAVWEALDRFEAVTLPIGDRGRATDFDDAAARQAFLEYLKPQLNEMKTRFRELARVARDELAK